MTDALFEQRRQRSLEIVRAIRKAISPDYSLAGVYWNGMPPAWRRLVVHAAKVVSGNAVFRADLAECDWAGLATAVGGGGLADVRRGIERAQVMLRGFGRLDTDDFSPEKAAATGWRSGADVPDLVTTVAGLQGKGAL